MGRGGLSAARLRRMHDVMTGYVERGVVPGVVTLVSRRGEVHVDAIGTMTAAGSDAIGRDTIFRISSMTKPVTAVATMILVEECRLRLDDAVDDLLPELTHRTVLKRLDGPLDDTVPADRPITVRHLLTFTLGLGLIMAPPGTYPIQRAMDELLLGQGPPAPSTSPAPDEWMRRLGSLPLIHQPGERWMYQVSGDVLGVLVARVSDRSLGAFMRERIFEPLGMEDTGFHVPGAKLHRLPALYFLDRRTGTLAHFDNPARSAWSTEPPFESGGGGLVSTVDDFFAFSRMMANGGRLGRERILSPATLALMTSDRLMPEQRAGAEIFFHAHSSWGLGFAVDIRREEIYHSPGRFGWTGGFGTTAYIDPAQDLIGILLTQRMMDSPDPPRVFTDFWTLAYGAIA